MQESAQRSAQGAEALDDVVVGAEDDGTLHHTRRQSPEQALKSRGGVNAYMWSQPVPKAARQVIDEELVPEMILPCPVNAVGFKGIALIRDEENRASTGLQDPQDLDCGRAIILNVFQHLVAQHQVEGRRGEGKALSGGVHGPGGAPGGLLGPVEIVLQPRDFSAKRRQALDVRAHTAAVLKYPTLQAVPSRARHHRQAPFLPCTPHIRRFAPQGCLVQAPIGHGGDYILREFWDYAKISLTVGPILLTPRSGQPPLFCLYKD